MGKLTPDAAQKWESQVAASLVALGSLAASVAMAWKYSRERSALKASSLVVPKFYGMSAMLAPRERDPIPEDDEDLDDEDFDDDFGYEDDDEDELDPDKTPDPGAKDNGAGYCGPRSDETDKKPETFVT